MWVCKFANFFGRIDLSQKTYGNVCACFGIHNDGAVNSKEAGQCAA